MNDLPLIDGYRAELDSNKSQKMGVRRMLTLSWRTWPFIRPLMLHLMVLLVLMLGGGAIGYVGLFVGTDIFFSKVLAGEKLQPFQATILLLSADYVTTDAVDLGEQKATDKTKDSGVVADETVQSKEKLTGEQRRTVRNRFLIWGALGGALAALFGYAGYYYSVWVWQNINQNLRVAMVESAESLSIRHHDEARIGDAMFRVYQDSALISNFIQSALVEPMLAVYSLLGALVIIALFDPWFTGFVLLMVTPMAIVAWFATPRIRTRALINRLLNSKLVSRTHEIFVAVKIVKANHAEAHIFKRFYKDSANALNAAYFLRIDMVLVSLLFALLGGVLLIVAEYVMAVWVIEERSTFFGAAVAVLVGFVIWNISAFEVAREQVAGLAFGSRGLLGTWFRMQDLFVGLERAFYLLDVEPAITDPAKPQEFPDAVTEVEWQNVGFSYTDNQPVLSDIQLKAKAGQITAIVGGTGAGKTTLMSLLLRLYEPNEGAIQINAININRFRVHDLRQNVAIALQKNVLFSETVANNIEFGSKNKKRKDIVQAAELATADKFISALEKGFDTELGERGSKLSSGQRQRLSIARAVVRDAPILVLDEPTASLDAKTERQVLENLGEWGKNRVIFLITHRVSTIRNADQIAFLQDGKIREVGSHDELMGRIDGLYRRFVSAESMPAEVAS